MRNLAVRDKQISPFKFRNELQISHLMFADDILLTFRANKKSFTAFKNLFQRYALFSGQSVNFVKSEIFFPKNASRDSVRSISSFLNMKVGHFPFKYLGAMIAPRRPPSQVQDIVLDQIRAKLSSWQSSYLSQAGRLVLINSVLNSIPLHSMAVSWSSPKYIEKVEQMKKKCLWSNSSQNNGLHLVKWDSVTLPKSLGGLGIHDLSSKSLSLQAKRVLDYLNQVPSLWVRLVSIKYQNQKDHFGNPEVNCSWCWRLFRNAFNAIFPGCFKLLNSGVSSSVDFDNWILDMPLCMKPTFLNVDTFDCSLTVDALITNQQWNISLCNDYFGSVLGESIGRLHLPLLPNDDKYIWKDDSGGSVTTKSAYRFLRSHGQCAPSIDPKWKSLWTYRS